MVNENAWTTVRSGPSKKQSKGEGRKQQSKNQQSPVTKTAPTPQPQSVWGKPRPHAATTSNGSDWGQSLQQDTGSSDSSRPSTASEWGAPASSSSWGDSDPISNGWEAIPSASTSQRPSTASTVWESVNSDWPTLGSIEEWVSDSGRPQATNADAHSLKGSESGVIEQDSETDSDDDDLSDEELCQAIADKAYQKYLELYRREVKQVYGDTQRMWSCTVCNKKDTTKHVFNKLDALLQHADTNRKGHAAKHKGLARALREVLSRPTSTAPQQRAQIPNVDKSVVWPPMVIIQNSRTDNVNGTWEGLGSQELKEALKGCTFQTVKHHYGPQGHLGTSVVIFEETYIGWHEAERLSNEFEKHSTGRQTWSSVGRHTRPWTTDGKKKLYGYMAEPKDMQVFYKHQAKNKCLVRHEIVSFTDKVVIPEREAESQRLQQAALYETAKSQVEEMQGERDMFRAENQTLRTATEDITRKLRLKEEEARKYCDLNKKHQKHREEEIERMAEELREAREQLRKQQEGQELAGWVKVERPLKEHAHRVQELEQETVSGEDQEARRREEIAREVELAVKDEGTLQHLLEEKERFKAELHEEYMELKKEQHKEELALLEDQRGRWEDFLRKHLEST